MIKSGFLKFEKKKLIGGEFEIDMTSLVCTDLSGEYKGKLEGHLKADDFFEVLKRYGVTSTDINEIFEHSAYTWSPPMDIDKFVNYDKYYWINWDLHIKFATLDTSTIVGKRVATVGTVELQDGMRIKFDADTTSLNAYSTSVTWIVSDVGNSITLEGMYTHTLERTEL